MERVQCICSMHAVSNPIIQTSTVQSQGQSSYGQSKPHWWFAIWPRLSPAYCICHHIRDICCENPWPRSTITLLSRHHNRCGGTLQSLSIKCYTTLISMTVYYRSAGNSARFLSTKWLTEKMGLSLSSECQYWGGGPDLWRQTVPRPRCSHRKRTVTEGGPTSWRHQQRRRATISDVSRRLSIRYAGAVSCTQWYARTHNRNWIRSGTRNQCNSRSSGVVCSDVRRE